MLKQLVENIIGTLLAGFVTLVFILLVAELFFGVFAQRLIWRFPIAIVILMVGVVGVKLAFALADKFDLHHAVK